MIDITKQRLREQELKNPENGENGFGLGLISMRERLNLLGGKLLIESQPSAGTRLKASVPFIPAIPSD